MAAEWLRGDTERIVGEPATTRSEREPGSAAPGSARPLPGRPGREGLIARFNQAVRRPAAHGGLSVPPLLMDLISDAGEQSEDMEWIPDANQRLSTAPIARGAFPDPAIHVTASQYGEVAFRHGWLHLDRTLTAEDHTLLLDRAAAWAETDRTVCDVLDEFGPASVTFGDPDPHLPKTLGYACGDREAEFAVFHFDSAAGESAGAGEQGTPAAASLLAVRGVHGGFLGLQLTPHGNEVCRPGRTPAPHAGSGAGPTGQ